MPTYTCTAAAGLLNADRKAAVARAITLAHAEVTGAPQHFAQVIFDDVPPGDHFVGGVPLNHDHVFVYGRIRAGRSAVDRKMLITRLTVD
ncbi:MAG: tautomerase family protein, partial [Pseudomonadota bacterium]